ncbi:MAG: hypothetical protein WBD33_20145, partial [Xanthobacteraceae bacterium]
MASAPVLAAHPRPSFAIAATVEVRRREWRDPKKKGWCLSFLARYARFAIRSLFVTTGLDPVVHAERWGSMDCRVKPG